MNKKLKIGLVGLLSLAIMISMSGIATAAITLGTSSVVGSGALTLTGTTASTWTTSAGALTITAKEASIWSTYGGDLTIEAGTTNAAALNLISDETNADSINVDSAGGIDIDTAAGAFAVDTIGGDITFDATDKSVVIDGGEAVADAVKIVASNAAGGVDFDAGTGGINIATTSTTADALTILASGVVTGTALNLTTTDGQIEIDANGATGGDVLVTAVDDVTITSTDDTIINPTGILTLTAGEASTWAATTGDLTVDAVAGSLILDSGEATADAVRITSSNAAGGFDFDAGTGGINIATTSTTADAFTILASGVVTGTALNLTTTDGQIEIDANGTTGGDILVTAVDDITITSTDDTLINPTGILTLTSGEAATWAATTGDLTVDAVAGSLILDSGEATADAVRITSSNVAGGFDFDAGTGGINIATTSTTADALTILASGVVTGTALNLTTTDGQIEIDANGATGGNVLVTAVDDVTITSTDDTIINPTGILTLTAGEASTWAATTGDLTVDAVAGSLILDSGEATADAVRITSSNAAGGFDFDAGTGGINIATTSTTADALTLSASGVVAGTAINLETTNGGIELTAAGANGDVIVTSADTTDIQATNALTIDSSAGAIGIGTDTDTGAINVGTAGARVITIGSTDVTQLNLVTDSGGANALNITGTVTTSGAITVTAGGIFHAVTTASAGVGNGETLDTTNEVNMYDPGGSRTGVILEAPTVNGQSVYIINIANAAETITFDVVGTSNVSNGTTAVIGQNESMGFISGTIAGGSLVWFPLTSAGQ